jgi:predicted DNA-binding transcriptional regulator AlpA
MTTAEATAQVRAAADGARQLYLTRAQVAELYHVSQDTITEWVKAGRFPPPVRLSSRTHRWRLADLPA